MKPFERMSVNLGSLEEFSEANKEMFEGFTDNEILFQYERLGRDVIFSNGEFRVNADLHSHINPITGGVIIHLIIARMDRERICDWRTIQDIKNIILGEEVDAVELFPMESRNIKEVVEHQRHLWCMPVGEVFPFGWFVEEPSKPKLSIVE